MMNETSKVEGEKIETNELFLHFKNSYRNSNITSSSVFGKRLAEIGYKVKEFGKKKRGHVFDVVYGVDVVEMIDSGAESD
eukprot:127210-Hanusia_phi.AAC.1